MLLSGNLDCLLYDIRCALDVMSVSKNTPTLPVLRIPSISSPLGDSAIRKAREDSWTKQDVI